MSIRVTATREAWSAPELAVAYGLSVGFVRKQIRTGTLPAKKIGRRVIVLDEDLRNFLIRHSLPPSSELVQGKL